LLILAWHPEQVGMPVVASVLLMAACNAETTVARALDGRYSAPATKPTPSSASPHRLRWHHPRPRRTAHPPRPLTAPAHPGPAALCSRLTQARAPTPAPGSSW